MFLFSSCRMRYFYWMKEGALLLTIFDEIECIIESMSLKSVVFPWLCLGILLLPDKDYVTSMIEFWSMLISDFVFDLYVRKFASDYVPFWSLITDFTFPSGRFSPLMIYPNFFGDYLKFNWIFCEPFSFDISWTLIWSPLFE